MIRANLRSGRVSAKESERAKRYEPIQTVAHGNVEGFSKNTIALLRVGDDLGVASRDVEDDR
jgi:hypothetical protein